MFSELQGSSQLNSDAYIPMEERRHMLQESDLEAVKDERRPAAWAGKMSPNVDIAAADLSLNMPTCPSVSIDPNFNVLSPNLLPTWITRKTFLH
jgi:hypothetical protein